MAQKKRAGGSPIWGSLPPFFFGPVYRGSSGNFPAALQQAATSSIRRPASAWPICRNTNAVETVCTTPHSQIPRSGTPVRAWSSRQRCLAFPTGSPSYSSIHSRMSTPRS